MLPFLIGEVLITKPDGTVVQIGGGNSSEKPAGGNSESVTTSSTPAKHHNSSSDTGVEVVPIVAIVFVFLWLIVKALMAPFTQRASRRVQGLPDGAQVLSEEEQAVLVKLQRTIVQMERRIESLETILIDEHRTKEKYGTKI